MVKHTTIFRTFARCCALLTLALLLPLSAQAGNRDGVTGGGTANLDKIIFPDAVTLGFYTLPDAAGGRGGMAGMHDFTIDAWNRCRVIDIVSSAGTVQGSLPVPYKTAAEWIDDGHGKGFIATSANRVSKAKLDLCRAVQALGTIDYSGLGGLSGTANMIAPSPAVVQDGGNAPFARIDTRSDPAFLASLKYVEPVQTFSFSRADCLGNITYPDGSVRNPCYTWGWTEAVTATFVKNINLTRPQAATAAMTPAANGAGTWSYTLANVCANTSSVSNDGRIVPGNSCPPAVVKPSLRTCSANAHNTKRWQLATVGNTQALHDCGPGYIEDPARIKTWDTEAEYWCFDGTDYPTGNTRQINAVVTGVCKPITNGSCGAAADTCAAGTVANQLTSGYMHTWSCQGINTGTTASCSKPVCPAGQSWNGTTCVAPPVTNGTCGTPGSYFTCGGGTTATDQVSGYPFYTWSCAGTNGGTTASCRECVDSDACCPAGKYWDADQKMCVTTPTVVNGECGAATWPSYSGTPILSTYCNKGNLSGTPTSSNGGNTYSWVCAGTGTGATDASCAVTKDSATCTGAGCCTGSQHWDGSMCVTCASGETWNGSACVANGSTNVGVCGSANGQSLTTAPSSGLCAAGTASAVSGSGPWSWSCQGDGGTTAASCAASKSGMTCPAGQHLYNGTCIADCNGYEERDTCPTSGYTGTHLQRRTVDQLSCQVSGSWMDYGTNSCAPACANGIRPDGSCKTLQCNHIDDAVSWDGYVAYDGAGNPMPLCNSVQYGTGNYCASTGAYSCTITILINTTSACHAAADVCDYQ